MTSPLVTEIMKSRGGVVFKRSSRPEPDEFSRGYSRGDRFMVVQIPKLPVYLMYIAQGFPFMYDRNIETNRLELNRPAYSICTAIEGQVPWVQMAGFTAKDLEEGSEDEVNASDFFDPKRPTSLDITVESDDRGGGTLLFEYMFVTAYFLIDCETKQWSIKGDALKHALITASTNTEVPNFNKIPC